jgi:glycosyltransferase involved in cell wall biosynthesis
VSVPSARLFYLGGFDLPSRHARSIQSVHTAHALARAGWTVRVVAQRPTCRAARRTGDQILAPFGLDPHPRLQIDRLPVLRPRPMPSVDIHIRLAVTNWSYGLGALASLLRDRGRFDLVLTRDPRIAWIFTATRRLHGCPVIYEVHELFSTRPRDNASLADGNIWGVAPRTRSLEASVLSGVDLLLPLTGACAAILADKRGVPPSRIAVVPDGTVPPSGDLPPLDRDRRRVVYAGQLYAWKGVDTLLRAMQALANVSLDLFGGLHWSDPNLERASRLARSLGVGARVNFHGPVHHADVRTVLAGARAGVVPLPDRLMSRYFTSPLKLFDYMAAGVPVVASDFPAIREVIEDGRNGLIVPADDPDALAASIRRLVETPALAESVRRAAFDDVRRYTWDTRAERIIRAAGPLL